MIIRNLLKSKKLCTFLSLEFQNQKKNSVLYNKAARKMFNHILSRRSKAG